jgi:F-box/leucine-rich repeat protein 2/20
VKLALSGCEASYDGIAAIGQCCFMLEELTLSNRGFCEGWIAALSYCTCLKTLRLEGCEQIDPAPGPSEHLYSCPALQRLELVRCNLRDKAGFGALVLTSSTIRELFFQDCWGLDDDTFKLVGSCRYSAVANHPRSNSFLDMLLAHSIIW